MKTNLWKWIIGLVLFFVLVGVAGYAIGIFLNNNGYTSMMYRGLPMHDFGGRGGFDGYSGRMPFFFGGFFMLGGLIRLLLPVGLLAAFGYFFYQMGKRSALHAPAAPHPVEPPAPVAESEIPPAPEA